MNLLFLPVGAAHGVDSSELAFKLAAIGAMREGKGLGGKNQRGGVVSEECLVSRFAYHLAAFPKAAPLILEPVMSVEVNIPQEFQVSELTRHPKYIFKTQVVAI